jgi:hypothetical protein
MMSVVMGGNVIIWSLIVTGSGVIVVDSVSLIGGSSMIQGGLHVTTGDDVSHIIGNAIVERLTLVVRLVLKVVLDISSNEEEAKDVVKTNDESAVDEVELVLPLICIAAVPVLVFELVRELSTTELVRLKLLDASENDPETTDSESNVQAETNTSTVMLRGIGNVRWFLDFFNQRASFQHTTRSLTYYAIRGRASFYHHHHHRHHCHLHHHHRCHHRCLAHLPWSYKRNVGRLDR